MHKNSSGSMKEKSSTHETMDGSDIMELVENEKAFSNFVDHKFQELNIDSDDQLSVQDLQPAVKEIGVAPGLPAGGTSPHTEVLNEFPHGKQGKISKAEFTEILSDFLVGMATGLKRDPVVILRIDGEDLDEFVKSPTFEPEILSIFSEIELPDGSLKDYTIKAFEKLTVDQGMPPAADPWVISNILEPALESLGDVLQQPVSQETFLAEFKRAAEKVVQLLNEQPAIVAHSQNTFDGSGIKRLLSNKFELEKMLDSALKSVPRDRNGKIPNEHLRLALDSLAPSAGLPPLGAVDQMDKIVTEVLNTFEVGDGKTVREDEFKKLLTEVLGSTMVQLEGNPVSVSINSVVHEQLGSSSTLLQPSSP